MSHEPECPVTFGHPFVDVCLCKRLRAAYQRGRADAERDVMALPTYDDAEDPGWLVSRRDAACAARGEAAA